MCLTRLTLRDRVVRHCGHGRTCSLPGPVAMHTRQSQDETVKKGLAPAPAERDHPMVTVAGSHPDCRAVLIQIVALYLVRARYLSLDPYMRGRMSDAKSYAKPVEIGEPMEGETVAEIVQSRHPDYRPGDLVQARSGWRTHAAISVEGLRRVDPALAPITTALGVLGMPGFTAYAGMKVIGQPKPGETVVVAAASGPVGSLVGQMARLAGARAVGIAGGPEKCAYLRDELGFDAAIDHRSKSFADQ